MIPTMFAKMVLRYRADVFLSVPPIVSVMDMFLSRIVLLFLSCWQPLMILVIKKGQCQQPQFFPAILFLGRVRIFFRPLDNNVVATFVSHCMITKYVLVSELVKIFYLTNLALGVALFTSIPPHIYSSSCTPPQHIRPQYRSFHEICVLK